MLKGCSWQSGAVHQLRGVTLTYLIKGLHNERVAAPRLDWHKCRCNIAFIKLV